MSKFCLSSSYNVTETLHVKRLILFKSVDFSFNLHTGRLKYDYFSPKYLMLK